MEIVEITLLKVEYNLGYDTIVVGNIDAWVQYNATLRIKYARECYVAVAIWFRLFLKLVYDCITRTHNFGKSIFSLKQFIDMLEFMPDKT